MLKGSAFFLIFASVMRRIWIVIIGILMLSACSHRSDRMVRAYLQDVETLVTTSPDSAYRRLKLLTSADLSSYDDYCYYYLLCMEAKMNDRCRFHDTSIMKRVAAHYKEKGDSLMQLRAALALGFVNFHAGDDFESIKQFNEAIRYAEQMGNKRLLALAYAHFAEACLFFGHQNNDRLVQEGGELYPKAIRLAQEVKDTLLWINFLWDGAHWNGYVKNAQQKEEMMLEAFRLAELSHNRWYQSFIAIELAGLYGVRGLNIPDKAFHYSMHSLKVREDEMSERIYHLFMANAYDNIGRKDSADYHERIGKSLPDETEHEETIHSFVPLPYWPDDERTVSSSPLGYVLPSVLLLMLVAGLGYAGVRHFRKVTALRRELEMLSSQPSPVYDKIKRIIKDHLFKDSSDLQMEEADWRMLQVETDKRWDGITQRLQNEYHLTDTEIRLFCLNLMGVPTSHMPYLIDRGRSTIYNKNRDLLAKLGIERTSATFKEDLKRFLEKRK